MRWNEKEDYEEKPYRLFHFIIFSFKKCLMQKTQVCKQPEWEEQMQEKKRIKVKSEGNYG